MHFLKCNKCGHLNEVKSEYLVFCDNCHTKLENNYNKWKEVNPDKSFEEYKQIVCTSEEGKIETEKIKKNTSTKRKFKSLKYGIGFIIVFAIFYAIGHFAGESIIKIFNKPAFNKEMMQMASEMNKNCPIMLDAQTRLDNTIALPDNVFQYNYTLINSEKASLDIEGLKKYLEPIIYNGAKTNPEMKLFRDNKTTLNYYYKDKSGVYLFTISVTPDKY